MRKLRGKQILLLRFVFDLGCGDGGTGGVGRMGRG